MNSKLVFYKLAAITLLLTSSPTRAADGDCPGSFNSYTPEGGVNEKKQDDTHCGILQGKYSYIL